MNYKELVLSAIGGWLECQDYCQGYGEHGALYPATFEAAKEFFMRDPQYIKDYLHVNELDEEVNDWTPFINILKTLEKPQWFIEYEEDEGWRERLKEHLTCMLNYRQDGELFYSTEERNNIKNQLANLGTKQTNIQGG